MRSSQAAQPKHWTSGTRSKGRGDLVAHVAVLIAAAFAPAGIPAAHAQQYPTKPIRIVVPFPPGGFSDVFARVIGTRMTESWGQQVIIDNRTGAGGNIGHGDRRQGAARRLHAGERHDRHARHQRDALQQAALRPGAGLHGRRVRRRSRRAAGRPSVAAGEDREGHHRARQSSARPAHIRIGRRGNDRAPRRRSFQDDGESRHHARALQRQRSRHDRPHVRPDFDAVRDAADGASAGAGGKVEGDCSPRREALCCAARHPDARGVGTARLRSEQLDRPLRARRNTVCDRQPSSTPKFCASCSFPKCRRGCPKKDCASSP